MLSSYVIHEHQAKRAGKHYDLRIRYPSKKSLISFAIPKARFPEVKEKFLVIKGLDHPLEWLRWSRPIKRGYGAGTFKIVQKGKAQIFRWENKHITFKIEGAVVSGRFSLIKISKVGKNAWILIRLKEKYLENYFDVLLSRYY